MALFSIEGVFTWGHFLTLKKKSTPNFILTVLLFSIVIFTCGFDIDSTSSSQKSVEVSLYKY